MRFEGRLFLGFRTAPNHFAGTKTRLYIGSSTDEGKTWDYETEVFMGSDMREPRFLALGDTAFPGLVKIDNNSYLIYNYSNDPEGRDHVWMTGQMGKTNINSTIITFE